MRWLTVIMLMFCNLSFPGQILATALDRPSQNQATTKDSLEADKLLELSDKYTFSEPEKAKKYTERAISAAVESGNKSGEIKGLYQRGSIHIAKGDRSLAKPHLESGLKKSRGTNNQVLAAHGYYNLSRFYEEESDYTNKEITR